MIRRLAILVGGTLGLWAVAAYPASLRWGEATIGLSAVAAVLCLGPTLATFLWGQWAQEQAPAQQMVMILGGTGLRMFVVLGMGLVLSMLVPYFKEPNLYTFWAWVLVFYLFTLGLEVTLLVVGRSNIKNSTSGERGAQTQPRSPE